MSKKSERNQVQQAGKSEKAYGGYLPSVEDRGPQEKGHASARLHYMPKDQPAQAADNFRDN